jgi:hypothetical protein
VPSKKYDADYWLARAEEARTIAAGMTVPAARLEMLKIAALYERLAKRSEQTAGRSAKAQKR